MISIIIPTYRNPEYLDICLKSAIEQQHNKNEIARLKAGFFYCLGCLLKNTPTSAN